MAGFLGCRSVEQAKVTADGVDMTGKAEKGGIAWEKGFQGQMAYGLGSVELPVTPEEGAYKNCFCQQIQQRAFLNKLERFSNVRFDWWRFAKELVYHALFPLSLPLLYFFEGGTRGLINRQFWVGKLGVTQWCLSACFFLLNGLTPFYVSPDIVITDILWIMRSMILATKYAFINKGEMHEMRDQVLPMEVHADRTLVLGWTNPIPLRVLKKQLFLSSVRKDQIRCVSALRLLPGASERTVTTIMNQFRLPEQTEKSSYHPTIGSGWGPSLDEDFGFNQTFVHCPECVRNKSTQEFFEDRWVNLCTSKIFAEPGLKVPDEAFLKGDESAHSSGRSEPDDINMPADKACPALDIPALFLAAYTIQRAGDLLKKKNFLHQIFSDPRRVFYASGAVALVHSVIPFASRAIAGTPSTFGGSNWYHIIVSVSCFAVSYSAMSASVMFMLAGAGDFRRRYFTARLLNTILKDGWYGENKHIPKKKAKLKQQWLLQQKSVYHMGLAVDFTDPRSVSGWWAVRVLVQDFGIVFHRRVKQYASYYAMYCALLMGFLIVELFSNNTRAAIYVLSLVVYDLLVFLFLLSLMVFPGGEANDTNHDHGATLVRKKMIISNQLHRADVNVNCKERKKLAFTLELLQSISQAVYWDNLINKVTILGFTAGGELFVVLIGFGSAAVGIAAQQLTSKIS